MTLGELNSSHLGKTLTFTGYNHERFTGILREVIHYTRPTQLFGGGTRDDPVVAIRMGNHVIYDGHPDTECTIEGAPK